MSYLSDYPISCRLKVNRLNGMLDQLDGFRLIASTDAIEAGANDEKLNKALDDLEKAINGLKAFYHVLSQKGVEDLPK